MQRGRCNTLKDMSVSRRNEISKPHALTALYGGALWYLVSPFTSAAAAAYVASFPWIVKFIAKSAIAFPMAYHTFNGFRHLLWDTASKYSFSLPGVYATGYATLSATVVIGLGYALF
ncbi:hypothetical protein BC830DRAFT_1105498, partial [Chytriomyces sp. MP71]